MCKWLKELRFPDGYASNMGRCVDMKKHKLFGMKSHDFHVFMQRLIPIAFRELLPRNVWQNLTEMSIFFFNLTSTVIKKEDMERLDEEIPIILCRLERIFPPSFFNSMEHLPIHLAYEAMIANPVQYKWMYPFERLYIFHFVIYNFQCILQMNIIVMKYCKTRENSKFMKKGKMVISVKI